MIQRVAITGSSGYYGRKLSAFLRREIPDVRLLGIDVIPPVDSAPDEFRKMDIRDEALRASLAEFRADTIIHLAFVLNPIRDTALMREINVGGTQNVFEAVRVLRPPRFMMSSSATTYGAWPDNPIPLTEESPLRPAGRFQYAEDKVLLEEQIQRLAQELSDVAVSWTRPTIIVGAQINNVITRLLMRSPVIVRPNGRDVPLQLVHEQDLMAATWEILKRNARGPFNVAPADYFRLSDVAKLTQRRLISLPAWFVSSAIRLGWSLRLKPFGFPANMCPYLFYPWVISPTRLQREFGFEFRYSAKAALQELWQEEQRSRTAADQKNEVSE